MTTKEKKETIEVLEKYIKYIEDNLTNDSNFLCTMGCDISIKDEFGIKKECGFNTRMIPNTISYIKSQRPTSKMNKEHYNSVTFHKNNRDFVWWTYYNPIATNMDKIRFLKHLISKLKK